MRPQIHNTAGGTQTCNFQKLLEERKPESQGKVEPLPEKTQGKACETPPKPSPVHPPHRVFFPSKLPTKSHSWPRAAIHGTSASILATHSFRCWSSAVVSVPLGERITGMRATLTPSIKELLSKHQYSCPMPQTQEQLLTFTDGSNSLVALISGKSFLADRAKWPSQSPKTTIYTQDGSQTQPAPFLHCQAQLSLEIITLQPWAGRETAWPREKDPAHTGCK